VHARAVERSAVVAEPEDLVPLVAHYQDKLRLRDWRIEVTYERDLRSSDGHIVWGLCYPNVDAKQARIVVRHPDTPPPGVTVEEARAAVVETLVHELLHLHFAPFGNVGPTAVAAEEQAVWAIAEALVKARGTADEARLANAVASRIETFARTRTITPETGKENKMSLDPKMAEQAVDLVVKKDQKGALAFVTRLLVASVGGKPDAGGETEEPAAAAEEPPPAEMTGEEPAAEEPPPAAARAKKVVATVDAFARSVLALAGKTDHAEALEELERRSNVVTELEEREATLTRDREALEGAERRRLVKALIDLRAETPATAWVPGKDGAPSTNPVKRLADESIASLRARVAALTPKNGKATVVAKRAPSSAHAGETSEVRGLSPREVALCKAKKIDPEVYRAKRDALLPPTDDEEN